MFNLKKPCSTCPFRKGQGERFPLDAARLDEIFEAPAFQCHGTLDAAFEDGDPRRKGNRPQQCAGLMSLLHREGKPNQMMQVASRVSDFDAGKLQHHTVYDTIQDAMTAHTSGRVIPPMRDVVRFVTRPHRAGDKCTVELDCGHMVFTTGTRQARCWSCVGPKWKKDRASARLRGERPTVVWKDDTHTQESFQLYPPRRPIEMSGVRARAKEPRMHA